MKSFFAGQDDRDPESIEPPTVFSELWTQGSQNLRNIKKNVVIIFFLIQGGPSSQNSGPEFYEKFVSAPLATALKPSININIALGRKYIYKYDYT